MPWNIHLHSVSGQMLVHVSLKESEARNSNCRKELRGSFVSVLAFYTVF